MNRHIAEWLWRIALIVLLVWIGSELHQLRIDVQPGPDDNSTTATTPDGANGDEVLQSLDDLRGDVDVLQQKVDALLASMTRL
jgi:uncharacterized protein YoxC